MHPRTAARVIARVSVIVVATSWLACSGDDTATAELGDCEQAIEHYQDLRTELLEADPVLAKFPDLAREHVRQTRDVVAAPLLTHCDHRMVRCLNAADNADEAAACAGGQR